MGEGREGGEGRLHNKQKLNLSLTIFFPSHFRFLSRFYYFFFPSPFCVLSEAFDEFLNGKKIPLERNNNNNNNNNNKFCLQILSHSHSYSFIISFKLDSSVQKDLFERLRQFEFGRQHSGYTFWRAPFHSFSFYILSLSLSQETLLLCQLSCLIFACSLSHSRHIFNS